MRHTLVAASIGVAIGLGVAAGLTRLMSSLLYGITSDYHLAYIVNGRFLEAAGRPRMLAELIRVSDGAHIWVRGYSNLSDGRNIGHEIGRKVARELKLDPRSLSVHLLMPESTAPRNSTECDTLPSTDDG